MVEPIPFPITPSFPEEHQFSDDETLKGSGGGGTFDGMEGRLSALETNVSNLKGDVGRIERKLDRVGSDVSKLATKGDFFGYLAATFTIALAVVAIVVGGIIGGLGWLEAYSANLHSAPTATSHAPSRQG